MQTQQQQQKTLNKLSKTTYVVLSIVGSGCLRLGAGAESND